MTKLDRIAKLCLPLLVTGSIAWGCAATEDVVAKGSPGGPDAAAGGSSASGGASGGDGGSGAYDAALDINLSDGPAGETCDAAVAAHSTYGCEYFALQVDTINEPTGGYGLPGACYAVFIANRGVAPVKIDVDRAGVTFSDTSFIRIPKGQGANISYEPYDAQNGLPPNEVAILFLSQGNPPKNMYCPAGITTAIASDTAVHGTGTGAAFHIKTSAPVSAYQIFPYGGGAVAATSATLLLPTSSWDVNYVAINAYKQSQLHPAEELPSLDIVAQDDGTTVQLRPVANIEGGANVSPVAAGQIFKYTLNRGQYVQFTQGAELTGSVILADKPVGVFGGATCINVPADKEACDTAQQQLLPVKQLGHEYVGVRYKGRRLGFDVVDENVPYRIVGAVDGTTLTYDPAPPPNAPSTVKQGEVAEFWTKDPFVVKSQDEQHPFYLATYMTGGADFLGEGDPEWVEVVPVGQYLDSYVFFTDPTYPETSLVVVRQKDKDGNFDDVNLDCMGTLNGWTPVGDYQWTRVTLVTGQFEGQANCQNGRQAMKSDGPFTATVWGWGSLTFGPTDFTSTYVSYAYPAGMGTNLINQVEIPIVK